MVLTTMKSFDQISWPILVIRKVSLNLIKFDKQLSREYLCNLLQKWNKISAKYILEML